MYTHFMIHKNVLEMLGSPNEPTSYDVGCFVFDRLADHFSEEMGVFGMFDSRGSEAPLEDFHQVVCELKNDVNRQFQGFFSTSPLGMTVEQFTELMTDAINANVDNEFPEPTQAGMDEFFGHPVTPEVAAFATMLLLAADDNESIQDVVTHEGEIDGVPVYYAIVSYSQILTGSAAYMAINFQEDNTPPVLH